MKKNEQLRQEGTVWNKIWSQEVYGESSRFWYSSLISCLSTVLESKKIIRQLKKKFSYFFFIGILYTDE